MAVITPVSPTLTGTTVTVGGTACAGGGDTVDRRGGDVALLFRCGAGGPHTVTIESYASPGPGEQELDFSVVIPANSERLVGPFPAAYENPATGNLEITYSAVTNLTVTALDLR